MNKKDRREKKKGREEGRKKERKEEERERKKGGRAKVTATMVLEAVSATGGKQQPR